MAVEVGRRGKEEEVGEEGGTSVSRGERTRRAVAIAAKGSLDEVGAGEGAECELEGHLEVESP